MEYIYLINTDKNIFEKIPFKKEESHKIISEIYFLKYRVPTEEDINDKSTSQDVKEFYKNFPLKSIKQSISDIKDNIPLFNIYHINIYLIRKENVYYRSVYGNYRFPGKGINKFFSRFLKESSSKISKITTDKVMLRKIRKVRLMKDFLMQLDLDQLYKSYVDVFTRYSPQFGNLITECSKPSFNNIYTHIQPYYTRKELINLALNMKLDVKYNIYDPANLYKICDEVSTNDISADVIRAHQAYIIKQGQVSMVKYYTIQGSYFMNQYMRQLTPYSEKNEYLEKNIKKVWKLIKKAPAFDNNYYIYRFVDSDSFLNHLEIGDYFVEKGFMSTTRDPFYRNDLYKFGFILMKIRIPKDIEGVALCLESMSLFPSEQEIILPPRSKFRLINKNKNCPYYHIDSDTAQQIKVRYEFEWVQNLPVLFSRKKEYNDIKLIDFMELEQIQTISMKEKTKIFSAKYMDDKYMFSVDIGTKIFNLVGESYNSTGAYNPFYAISSEEGFSIYTIYEGNVLFMIELGDNNDEKIMIVNFYLKYTNIDRTLLINEYDFVLFLCKIAYYFEIPTIIIYSDFMACGNSSNSNSINNKNKDKDTGSNSENNQSKKQRGFSKTIYETTFQNEPDESDKNGNNDYYSSYHSRDIYRYLKYGEKRFSDFVNGYDEISPNFSYDDLDKLAKTDPLKVLDKEDNDELYQIYLRNYNTSNISNNNLKDFYLWIVDKYCYLIEILVQKMDRLYGKTNPFMITVYTLTPDVFLYNRKKISYISDGMATSYPIKKIYAGSINLYRDQVDYIKKTELF